MTCPLVREIAVGDTLSKFATQLTRAGIPTNLTGKVVKFEMYDDEGEVAIAQTDTGITVSDAVNGWVDYDFQTSFAAGEYKAFITVWDSGVTEPDTYPSKEVGISIIFFDKATAITTPEPTIDIIAAANTPLRVRTFEGTVQERTIDELIKADRYAQGQEAIGAVPWGMRIAKTKPPSTLS